MHAIVILLKQTLCLVSASFIYIFSRIVSGNSVPFQQAIQSYVQIAQEETTADQQRALETSRDQ